MKEKHLRLLKVQLHCCYCTCWGPICKDYQLQESTLPGTRQPKSKDYLLWSKESMVTHKNIQKMVLWGNHL